MPGTGKQRTETPETPCRSCGGRDLVHPGLQAALSSSDLDSTSTLSSLQRSWLSTKLQTLPTTLSHPHSHTCPLQSGFYHTHSPRPPYLILLHWLAKSNGNPSAFKILKLIIKHQTGDTSLFQIPSSFKLTSPLFYFPGEEFHHLLKSYNK